MKPHIKHPPLKKPNLGYYGRNEFAILGAPCDQIKSIAYSIIQHFSDSYKFAYLDAEHPKAGETPTVQEALSHGAHLNYNDKFGVHQYDLNAKIGSHQFRVQFNAQDILLINGNHFIGKKQIVIIDPKKEKSLKKRLDRLTDVQFFILEDGVDSIPEYLIQHLGEISQIPVFKKSAVDQWLFLLKQKFQQLRPPINGLVLAGGKSERMGRDKGLIDYHGVPQRNHAYQMLEELCEEALISCREEQVTEIQGMHTLPDSFTGLGPFGAILSAFRKKPDEAWLVMACDLPFVNRDALIYLLENRDPSKVATAFYNPETDFPEPLITIWEPRSYQVCLQFLAQGYACPRKVLINSDIALLHAPDSNILTNVNDEEGFKTAIGAIKK